MEKDFSKARHTIVLSDVHLSDAEPPHPRNALWKRFKRPRFFVDRAIRAMLEKVQQAVTLDGGGEIELILNGDIFDFDSVMAIPSNPIGKVSWLERLRGLAAEEWKSCFKFSVILRDHPVFIEALRDFILKGHRVVFVIGNHDIELHWPSVRQALVDRLDLPEGFAAHLRFCDWFYISNGDTLIEHGNQYDDYTVCSNPINPLIRKNGRAYVRIPFGNLAGKFMLNGMGLMNPHAESSFIKSSIREYLVFYYRYVIRTQPLLMYTWFWSALVTLVYSVRDGLLPAMTDPLTMDTRINGIAENSNSTPQTVWSMRELRSHPAVLNPFKILRELWLDRALILGALVYLSFQFFSTLNVFVRVSFWWFVVPFVLLLPLFIFYARSVQSEVMSSQAPALLNSPIAARIARVSRVIQGHTHIEKHLMFGGIEYLNTGTWSPAYQDVECTKPYGRKCFAWLRPGKDGVRVATLYEWKGDQAETVPKQEAVPNLKSSSNTVVSKSVASL